MIVGLVISKKDTHTHQGSRGPKIRCPKCAWEPAREDRWYCDVGCGHGWNTFETGGRCRACGKQWLETVCLRCHAWSPHDEWYFDADRP